MRGHPWLEPPLPAGTRQSRRPNLILAFRSTGGEGKGFPIAVGKCFHPLLSRPCVPFGVGVLCKEALSGGLALSICLGWGT